LDGVAARLGAEHLATAAPLRHRLVAVPRAAGALLLVHLLAGDRDFRAVLGVMRAGHALQHLIAHHAMDEVGTRLQAENLVVEIALARTRGVQRLDGGLHDFCSALAVSARASALRKEPGLGASPGSGRLTASRTSTQPPLLPGTAPRTRTRPRSLSVCTTS